MPPIKPENKARYPKDWPQIRARIRERAQDRCEECDVPNHVYRLNSTDQWTTNPLQAETWRLVDGDKVTYIVCTVAHLDHQPKNCDPANLKFLCQRCHLRYDSEHHKQTAYQTRRQHKAAGDLFDDHISR